VSDFEPVQTPAAATGDDPAPAVPHFAPAETAPTVEIAEGTGIPAPQLLGKTVRDVTEECLKMGLTPALVGTGIATEQFPEPGVTIRRGSRITVQFSRDASLLSATARGKVK
jgi:PASTA domain-containing protein